MGSSHRSARGGDRVAVALLGLALVLALLRFVRLDEWSLWLDEVLALADALHGQDLKNPLGYRLLGAWLSFFDGRADEATLRLPSAICGFLGVPLTYLCLREAAGRRRAATAALLLAASGWHLYWSQTARFYTLAQDLDLVAGGLVLHGLLRDRRAPVIAGILVAGAGALAHPSAVLFAAALVAAPLLAALLGAPMPGRRASRTLLVFGIVAAVAALGWGAVIWKQWSRANVGGGTPVHFALTTGFFVTPALGAAALVGVLTALRRRRKVEVVLVLVPTLGLLGVAGASLLGRAGAQYVFVQLPWIALAAALAIVPERERGGEDRAPALRAGLLAVLVLTGIAEQGLYMTVRHGERPRWREAWAFVDANRRPDDLLLGVRAPVGEYYLAPTRTDLRDLKLVTYLDSFTSWQVVEWDRHARRTWLVVNREDMQEWGAADRDRVLQVLREECRLVREFPVRMDAKDLDVQVYLRE